MEYKNNGLLNDGHIIDLVPMLPSLKRGVKYDILEEKLIASSDNKLDLVRGDDIVEYEYGEDYLPLKVKEEKGHYYITYFDYKRYGWYQVELQKTYSQLAYDPANIKAIYKKVGPGLIRYEVK